MIRRTFFVWLCLLGTVLMALPTAPGRAASMHIEVIQLHNRTADEAVPLLRPFLVPGGAITGTGYKLIVKTTPDNLVDIKNMLKDIDAGLRELIISVRQGAASQTSKQGASVNAQVRVGGHGGVTAGGDGIGPYAHEGETTVEAGHGGSHVGARVYGSESRDQAPAEQHIRVLEGQWANITTGTSIPVLQRQRNSDGSVTVTMQYKDVTTGFQVLPRVNGNRVVLEIRPKRSSVSHQGGGVINTEQAETTLSGNLGQWIEIGGVSSGVSSSASGITYRAGEQSTQASTISVKVDLAR